MKKLVYVLLIPLVGTCGVTVGTDRKTIDSFPMMWDILDRPIYETSEERALAILTPSTADAPVSRMLPELKKKFSGIRWRTGRQPVYIYIKGYRNNEEFGWGHSDEGAIPMSSRGDIKRDLIAPYDGLIWE